MLWFILVRSDWWCFWCWRKGCGILCFLGLSWWCLLVCCVLGYEIFCFILFFDFLWVLRNLWWCRRGVVIEIGGFGCWEWWGIILLVCMFCWVGGRWDWFGDCLVSFLFWFWDKGEGCKVFEGLIILFYKRFFFCLYEEVKSRISWWEI